MSQVSPNDPPPTHRAAAYIKDVTCGDWPDGSSRKRAIHSAASFNAQALAMRKLLEFFFDVDEPPERMGVIGWAIIAVFLLFCAYMWFHHLAQ